MKISAFSSFKGNVFQGRNVNNSEEDKIKRGWF